jgi:hypothetical protein
MPRRPNLPLMSWLAERFSSCSPAKDLPALNLANGEIKNLGRFDPNLTGQYHALLARGLRGAAGQWAGLGIWTQPSFSNRESGLCCLTSNGPG